MSESDHIRLFVNSEIAPLRAILMGFIDNFKIGTPVNSVQRYYYANDPPRPDIFTAQYETLAEIFDKHGVSVYRYDRKPDNMGRPFCRDAVVVIRDTLLICSMKNRPAPDIRELLGKIGNTVITVAQGIAEGGDLMWDNDILYVGMGERTDPGGLEWLKNHFGNTLDIQPIYMKSDVLHLDVVFNLFGKNIALIYPPAFEEKSLNLLKKRYRIFEITREEQFLLGTNLVSLTPETVISENRLNRINAFFRKEGFELIMTDYSEVAKLGGLFRCSTCPLERA